MIPHLPRTNQQSKQGAALLREVRIRSVRRITLLFGLSVVAGFSLLAPPWPGEQGWQLLMLTASWVAVCGIAYFLADRWLAAAQVLFLAALAATAMIALSLGINGSILIGIMALLTISAWIVARDLAAAASASAQELATAQVLIEEARSQRLELRQVEEDLLQANREQIRLVTRLEALNQIAESARQTKQAFIANVSHELRTPLNMIIAYAELITQSPHLYSRRLPSTLLADMNVILRNSQHLSRLVDDVLDLSQIETGRMALSKEWTTITEIVAAATEAVSPLFQTKGLQFEVETAGDLPEIYCDKTRIRQVLINLLSNAGRFTEQGGVKVRAWLEDTQFMLSVADTGPGIGTEDQQRLFEPFQQLDASIRRKHGGSGLGLNISKHFIEMHEGRIWLESTLGVGTTFTVSLPLAAMPKSMVATPGSRRWVSPFHEYYPRTRPRVAKIPHLGRRYVVLDTGNTLPRLLSRYADEVEIVSTRTLAEAIQVLEESPAHAFVVNSAGLPSEESIHGLPHSLPFDTPLFACWLTSDDSVQQLGIAQYMVKPVTGAMLLEAVRSLPSPAHTVMVADDEPDLLQLFTRVLAGAPESYRVIGASNGVEALALLHASQPDVLILDLLMPQMSGFDLLKERAADPALRAIPVIVVSSRDPSSQPIVSNQLLVARGSGLSMRDLLDSIEALTQVLTPAPPHERPTQPAAPRA